MKTLGDWLSKHRVLRFLKWTAVDFLIIVAAYSVAYSARTLLSPFSYIDSFDFIVLAAFITIASLYLNDVYKRIWTQTSGHGIVSLVQSMIMASAVILGLLLLIDPRPLPLTVFIPASILTFGGLVVVRYRSRLVGAAGWRWRAIWRQEFPDLNQNTMRTLIIGAGESGQMTALRLKHRIDEDNPKIVGFVDDDPDKLGMYVEGCPVVGETEEIPQLVRDYDINLLVMAIHNISGPAFRRILELCEETGALIKVVPDMYALINKSHTGHMLRDVEPEDLIGRSIVSRHEAIDMSPVMNRVVLVTGAAGSIGSEISRQMAEFEPEQLILLDNNESALHDLYVELQSEHKDIELYIILADVTHYDQIQTVFNQYQPQIIYHAAAYKHVPMLERYPNEAVRVNIGGTLNVAELAIIHESERFVLISTDKAVRPSSVMGASKRICEMIIHHLASQSNHKTFFTAVRFGNVLGSRGSVVPTFERQIERGGPVTVTDKRMTRYFMSIPEASNLVIHAAAMTDGDDIFVLHMGEEIKIDDIARRMIRLRGLRPETDIEIKYIGIRPGEKLREELYNNYEGRGPTDHPQIMKLDKWLLDGVEDEFMQQVRRLVKQGITSDNSPLEQFLEICQPDRPVKVIDEQS